METNHIGPSGQVDDFPFLLRASGTLHLVKGKEDFLKGVMSRCVYNYFVPELLFVLMVLQLPLYSTFYSPHSTLFGIMWPLFASLQDI